MCNQTLRGSLTLDRSLGITFDDAWPKAVRAALAGEGRERAVWAQVLNDDHVARAWRRAYERREPTTGELALALFATPAGPRPAACLQFPVALVA